MPKIVYAPILEQAGFLKRKAAAVVEQWVAQLDGATQSWVLSDPIIIPASTDCSVSFTLKGSNDTYEGIFRSADGSDWFRLIPLSQGNNFQGNLAGAFIGGVPYSALTVRNGQERAFKLRRVSGRFYIDVDDQTYTLSVASGEFSISVLCEFGGGEFGGYIKEFEVEIGGVLTNSITLTNKAQGATQLATVGNVNAFMPNYTEAVWQRYQRSVPEPSNQVTTSDNLRVMTSDNQTITASN